MISSTPRHVAPRGHRIAPTPEMLIPIPFAKPRDARTQGSKAHRLPANSSAASACLSAARQFVHFAQISVAGFVIDFACLVLPAQRRHRGVYSVFHSELEADKRLLATPLSSDRDVVHEEIPERPQSQCAATRIATQDPSRECCDQHPPAAPAGRYASAPQSLTPGRPKTRTSW